MSAEQYRSKLPKQDITSGDKRISDVLTHAKQQVGMVPNMYAFMSNAPELLETYLSGYDKFRKDSGFTSVEQEVVFLTISFENACDYCMAAHSTIADGPSKVPKDVTDTIRANAPIAEPKLAALSKLTRTLFATRGRPSNDDVQEFLGGVFGKTRTGYHSRPRREDVEQLLEPRIRDAGGSDVRAARMEVARAQPLVTR